MPMTDTQCTVRVAVANPIKGGNVTVTPVATGCTITPSTPQVLTAASVTESLDTTAYVDFTVDRPAVGSPPGSVTFTSTSTDRSPDTDIVAIPAQELRYVNCVGKITATTATTVTVTVTATSLAGTPTVGLVGVTGSATLSSGNAAGTYTHPQNGTANVWVFNRGAINAGAGQAQFRAVLSGYQSDDDLVTIEEQGRDTVPLLSRARVTATTSTTVTARVAVADPYPQGANSVTVTYQDQGSGGVTPASGGTLTPAATLTEAAGTYIDYTITRPSFQAGTGRVTFTAAASNRTSDSDAVDVPAQERDTQAVQVRIERVSETKTQLIVRVKAICPNSDGTVSVAVSAGGLTVGSSGSTFTATQDFATTNYIDYTITRPARGDTSRRVAFTVSRSGYTDGTDGVDVDAISIPMACRLSIADANTYTDDTWITLAWSGGGVELEDTDSMHSTVTNNSRITIPTGGSKGRWYIGAGGVFTGLAGTLVHVRLRVMKNGVEVGGAWDAKTAAAAGSDVYTAFLRVSRLLTVADGDYFEIQVLQKTGANNGSFDNAYFEAVQLIGE